MLDFVHCCHLVDILEHPTLVMIKRLANKLCSPNTDQRTFQLLMHISILSLVTRDSGGVSVWDGRIHSNIHSQIAIFYLRTEKEKPTNTILLQKRNTNHNIMYLHNRD